MERAIKGLGSTPDKEFFKEVAAGIELILENVERFDAAAHKLTNAGDHHPARILGNLAEEEAAKVLILMDAVRCPRNKQPERDRTLGYFYDHLAKGIYADVCNWRPVNFAEMIRGIERERVEFYLDGPNDVDWIFPNQITQHREDELYVSYVCDDSDQAGQGDCYWLSPRTDDLFHYRTASVIDVTKALHLVGATKPASLAIVADIWRVAELLPETRSNVLEDLNFQTLQALNEQGFLLPDLKEEYATIQRRWPFPLWPVDLRVLKVKKENLRDVRRQWVP